MFLGGPPLVKMAIDEDADEEELGGAEMHARVSGLADYLAADEVDAIRIARDIVSHLRWHKDGPGASLPDVGPRYDPVELRGIAPADVRVPFDIREVLARVMDGSEFEEFKPLYGPQLVCGWGSIHGYPVGVLANNGILFSAEAHKGSQFIQLANRTDTPLLFVQNITGFMVGTRYEQGGIIKDGAKLINAVSNSSVPHVTLMVGASYGAGNYAMSGRAYDPRFVFTWPNHRIAVMGPETAGRRHEHRDPWRRPRRGGRPRGPGRGRVDCAVRHRSSVGRRCHRPGRHRAPYSALLCPRAIVRRCTAPARTGSSECDALPAGRQPRRDRRTNLPNRAPDGPAHRRRLHSRRRGSAHVASADTAVAVSSYLEGPAVVAAALRAGADAVHPGYGFLAENAGFAGSVIAAGLTWVGPRPESIAAMGDKLEAKRLMAAADVPVLTGGAVSDAEAVGYPLLVKATAGGGGKGMRLVTAPEELAGAVESASREAASAFGDGTVFVERWLAAPRHVEVQVIGDVQGRVVGLGERECSVQRRHQKIIEEAPSPGISAALRARLIEAAVAGTRAIRYVGVGTMEFLVAGEEFFFLEMNTRLQVEHPVTECVTGLDLVRLQLLVAQGEPLELVHTEVGMTGHAIEARLYAEDPSAGYLPSPGTLHRWRPGPTPGVRYDAGVVDGTVVPPDYDPLLAKIIVHASTRDEASARLARALRELRGARPPDQPRPAGGGARRPRLAGRRDHHGLSRAPADARLFIVGAGRSSVAHAAAAVLAGAAERQASAVVAAFATPGWRNVPTGPAQVTLAPAGGGDPVEVAYRLAPELEVIIGGTTMPGRAFAMRPGAG